MQIADGPEVWVENTDLSTTLVIAKARQQHAGGYTVLLRDRRNSAQHTLTLIVIGRIVIHTVNVFHEIYICVILMIFF